jgi:predicted alpha/beta-hydrolase family hydrolase
MRGSRDTGRTFVSRFVGRNFAEATNLLTDDGLQAVVDSFPEALQRGPMDANDVLEQYWWGLHGQYGEPDGISEMTVNETGEASIAIQCENGTQTATIGLDSEGVSDFSFKPTYEPPTYADKDAFTERTVTINAVDITLDGHLTIPNREPKVPGVLLVHGAGVHDPDGTVDNSKILKDIAWGLATEGIASLRYESRLADHDVPDEEFTLDKVVVEDAVAAACQLGSVDHVREDTLFVAGHSQGGIAAPRIADRHGSVAGVVNFDGKTNPGALPPEHADIIRYEFEKNGELDEVQAAQMEKDRETLQRISDGDFDDEETLMGRPGVWHRSLRSYDPVSTIRDLDTPIFVLNTNGADEETQPELAAFFRDKYEAWRDAALPDNSRVKLYPNVNHYFHSVTPPTNLLDLYFGGNVTEDAITDVVQWVQEISNQ